MRRLKTGTSGRTQDSLERGGGGGGERETIKSRDTKGRQSHPSPRQEERGPLHPFSHGRSPRSRRLVGTGSERVPSRARPSPGSPSLRLGASSGHTLIHTLPRTHLGAHPQHKAEAPRHANSGHRKEGSQEVSVRGLVSGAPQLDYLRSTHLSAPGACSPRQSLPAAKPEERPAPWHGSQQRTAAP